MSLYLKYRPKDFDSLVGQGFIKKALAAALSQDKTVGAYLFYGSRGTGKTSVARIFAKAINCLSRREDGNPCDACEMCASFKNGTLLDIIEIDGASNNGVANVRELIEKAKFLPTLGKKKVYIIDEVHMLSIGAFNALLKILEEPPEHVVFILATTELHKIPETIISRTQRFDFRKISEEDIIARLEFVAKNESIVAESEAIQLVAKLAKGGLRDALSLFEQYTVGGTLSREFLEQNLSLVSEEVFAELFGYVSLGNVDKTKELLVKIRKNSTDPRRFLEQGIYYLRNTASSQISTSQFNEIWRAFKAFSQAYAQLKDFPDGMLLVEMTVYSLLSPMLSEVASGINQISSSQNSSNIALSKTASSSASRATMSSVAKASTNVGLKPADEAVLSSSARTSTFSDNSPIPEPPTFSEPPPFEYFSPELEYDSSYSNTTPISKPTITSTVSKPAITSTEIGVKFASNSPISHTSTPTVSHSTAPISESDTSKNSHSGTPKPFSLQELIAFVRTIPRTALFVAKLKSCTYRWDESTNVFELLLPNEFDKNMIDKPETREILARAFHEIFHRDVEAVFGLANGSSSNNLSRMASSIPSSSHSSSSGAQSVRGDLPTKSFPETSQASGAPQASNSADLHPDDIADVF